MLMRYLVVAVILLTGMIWSARARKLTLAGSITGGITGFLVFSGGGFPGLIMMTVFFLLGTLATSWKRAHKEAMQLAESRQGRTAGQVIANAGVAALCVLIWPNDPTICCYLMAAAFSSAAADTVSSELGNVYGSRYYNILTFRKDTRGLNGVVSLEGTLLGVIASAIIALIYAVSFRWNWTFYGIIAAGTIGNFTDSILGATLERKKLLHNDAVNFLNTLLATVAAWVLYDLLL